jgi:hypothetical protein
MDIFEQQVGCEQQILGCSARPENSAIVTDSQLQAAAPRDPNLPRDALQNRTFA